MPSPVSVSVDTRPRTIECAVTQRPMPDPEDAPLRIAFPADEADADLQTVLRNLADGWIYVRAYRVVPDPATDAAIQAMEAQMSQVQQQMQAQGATDDQIDEVSANLEAQIPEPVYRYERVHAVVSPEAADALLSVGLGFDDGEGDGDFDGGFDGDPGEGEGETIDLGLDP